jgi:hypothetical protein
MILVVAMLAARFLRHGPDHFGHHPDGHATVPVPTSRVPPRSRLTLGIGNLTSLPPLIAQREFDRADVASVVALVVAITQGPMHSRLPRSVSCAR